jgi:hypothetical protein
MLSPQERYRDDPQFRQLVDWLTAFVHQAAFTPSELREAAILACIRYEQTRIPDLRIEDQGRAIRHLKAVEDLLDPTR